jgi:hypothetical protein
MGGCSYLRNAPSWLHAQTWDHADRQRGRVPLVVFQEMHRCWSCIWWAGVPQIVGIRFKQLVTPFGGVHVGWQKEPATPLSRSVALCCCSLGPFIRRGYIEAIVQNSGSWETTSLEQEGSPPSLISGLVAAVTRSSRQLSLLVVTRSPLFRRQHTPPIRVVRTLLISSATELRGGPGKLHVGLHFDCGCSVLATGVGIGPARLGPLWTLLVPLGGPEAWCFNLSRLC